MAHLNLDRIDLVIHEELERAAAAKQLRQIAARFPDLFERVAECVLQQDSRRSAPDLPPPLQRGSSPTQAVIAWLRLHDAGTAGQIVKDVVGQIETTSSRPQNIVYSTLASLERRGKIKSRETPTGEKVYYLE